jgi:hypothetical protein
VVTAAMATASMAAAVTGVAVMMMMMMATEALAKPSRREEFCPFFRAQMLIAGYRPRLDVVC